MDPRVKELRLMRWKEIIVACNTSGMKKKEWMEANHINSKSFYRMQKEIREYELEKMPLPRLSEMNSESPQQFVDTTTIVKGLDTNRASMDRAGEKLAPEVMLQAGPYNLYIGSGVTEATLATVLKVIGHA